MKKYMVNFKVFYATDRRGAILQYEGLCERLRKKIRKIFVIEIGNSDFYNDIERYYTYINRFSRLMTFKEYLEHLATYGIV